MGSGKDSKLGSKLLSDKDIGKEDVLDEEKGKNAKNLNGQFELKKLFRNATRRNLFNMDQKSDAESTFKNSSQKSSDSESSDEEEEKMNFLTGLKVKKPKAKSASDDEISDYDTEFYRKEDPIGLRVNRILDDYMEQILINYYGDIKNIPKKYNFKKWKQKKVQRYLEVKKIQEDEAVERALNDFNFLDQTASN
jgi:hypothetical protein